MHFRKMHFRKMQPSGATTSHYEHELSQELGPRAALWRVFDPAAAAAQGRGVWEDWEAILRPRTPVVAARHRRPVRRACASFASF